MLHNKISVSNVKATTLCVMALFTVLTLSLFGQRSLAAGTLAGTVISNQAYADYKDANGNSMTRVYSNTVTTTVSQVAGLSLVPATATDAAGNNTTVMFLVQFFNTGNGDDSYDFTYQVTSGWTPTSVTFYYDTNNSHTYEAGVDTIINPVGGKYTTGNAEPDDDYDVLMFVTVPAGAADASNSVIKITGTSKFDGTVTNFGTYNTVVAASVITAVKTHSPNSLYQLPGSIVTYTINLTNSGTVAGTNVVISDPIPANLTYVPGSITLNGVAKTDANDGDEANFNVTTANAVTINVGTINPSGGIAQVSFQVRPNVGTPSGTAITNQASLTYNSGANVVNTTTNGRTFFVTDMPGVDLAATVTGLTGDPGDQIVQKFTLTNNGNLADRFDLTYTSSKGWNWVLWLDENGDGKPGTGGDYIVTDIDGDGTPDVGPLPQNGTATLLAVATIPAGTPDRTVDSLTVKATSDTDRTITDSQAFTTTVTAPVLSMSKTVLPTGSQKPGTVLTYTITVTNAGTGVSSSVVITDPVPANTTYKAGSIKTGQTLAGLVARTDANDGDGAYYDSAANVVVEGTAGNISIGTGGTEILQFSVTIK